MYAIFTCKACQYSFPRNEAQLDKLGHIKMSLCKSCAKERINNIPGKKGRSPVVYRQGKKEICEACNKKYFSCQLDVDHIDGNRFNNLTNNLQTLCANCHRLKTHLPIEFNKLKNSDLVR